MQKLMVYLCFWMLCSCAAPTKVAIRQDLEPQLSSDLNQSPLYGLLLPRLAAPQLDLSAFDPTKPIMIEVEEFDAQSIETSLNTLESLKKAGFKDVWVRIDSYGGSVDEGMQLIQAIEGYGSPVTCVSDTKAMSMGFFLLQACDQRLMTKRSILMAHEPSMTSRGNVHELQSEMDYLRLMMEGFIDHCLERMNISKEEFKKKTENKVWYMGWEEAMKVGAVDDTISPNDLPPLLDVEVPLSQPMLPF